MTDPTFDDFYTWEAEVDHAAAEMYRRAQARRLHRWMEEHPGQEDFAEILDGQGKVIPEDEDHQWVGNYHSVYDEGADSP